MLTWVLDLLLAVALTALEIGVLVAFWFVESVKTWAAQGRRPLPDPTVRILVVLSLGSVLPSAAAVGCRHAGLPVTAVAQITLAAPLTLILGLGLATETSKRTARRSRSNKSRPGGA